MASIYIIPTVETIQENVPNIRTIELALFNGSHKVGEAKLVMFNYNEIRENGKRLENIAKSISEDMNFAMNALSKHSLFAYEVLCDTERMYCRVPIIAYVARLYVYPEYRGKGYGKAFIKMLPDAIKSLTFSYPLAICVYISPQTKMMTHTGTVADIPKKRFTRHANPNGKDVCKSWIYQTIKGFKSQTLHGLDGKIRQIELTSSQSAPRQLARCFCVQPVHT